MPAILNRNSKAAQTIKLEFYLQAAQGQPEALLIWADWLEDNGSKTEAARVRRDYRRHAGMEGETIHKQTWLEWHCDYQLGLLGEKFISCTAFRKLKFHGNWRPDGTMWADDGSLEYAIVTNGYTPTLSRSNPKQATLGRIVEALGYNVFWVI
jgi:hypothetical protein